MLLQLVDTIIAQRLNIVDGNIATILAIVLVPVVLIGLAQEKGCRQSARSGNNNPVFLRGRNQTH